MQQQVVFPRQMVYNACKNTGADCKQELFDSSSKGTQLDLRLLALPALHCCHPQKNVGLDQDQLQLGVQQAGSNMWECGSEPLTS